jgi:hypothetical protein
MAYSKAKPMPPLFVLQEAFDLDAERGVLIRKKSVTTHSAGAICGTKMPTGHVMTYVAGKRWLVHRLVYFMATGIDPLDNVIDHINGIPDDNRISNLRLATKKENSRHKVALCATNTSGHRNVSWSKKWNCWLISLTVDGRRIQRHARDLAAAAQKAAELRAQHYGVFVGLTA